MRAAVRSNAPCMPQAAAEAGVTRCTKEGCRKRTCGTCGDCASHNCACNGPPSGKRETAGAPAGPRGPDTGEPPPDTDRVLRPRVEYVAGKYAEVASSEGCRRPRKIFSRAPLPATRVLMVARHRLTTVKLPTRVSLRRCGRCLFTRASFKGMSSTKAWERRSGFWSAFGIFQPRAWTARFPTWVRTLRAACCPRG